MGVLVKGTSNSVLIDGLHEKHKEECLFSSPELARHITYDLKPDFLLFTHYYKDHYNSILIKQFLKNTNTAVIIGPEQVTEVLKEYIGPKVIIANRISPGISDMELSKLKRKYPEVFFLTESESKIQLN